MSGGLETNTVRYLEIQGVVIGIQGSRSQGLLYGTHPNVIRCFLSVFSP